MKITFKVLLKNGIIIAIATFIGYLLTVSYNAGILSTYKIPLEFISVDISKIMLTLIAQTLVIFIVISLVYVLYNSIYYYKLFLKSVIVVSIICCIWFIGCRAFLPGISDKVLYIPILLLVVSGFIAPTVYLLYKYRMFKGFRYKMHVRNVIYMANAMQNAIVDPDDKIYIEGYEDFVTKNDISTILDKLSSPFRSIENPSKEDQLYIDMLNLLDFTITNNRTLYNESRSDDQQETANLSIDTARDIVGYLTSHKKRIRILESDGAILSAGIAMLTALLIGVSFLMGTLYASSKKYYWESYMYKGYMLITTKNDVSVLKEHTDGAFTDNILIIPTEKLGDMKMVNLKKQ